MWKLSGIAALFTALASCNHNILPHQTEAQPTPRQKLDHYTIAQSEVSIAAQELLNIFSENQITDIQTDFSSNARQNWHYIPRERAGIPIRDMSSQQKEKARALIQATLSSEGVIKVDKVMALETILREIENANPTYRDPENYALQIYGAPGQNPWGWRIEGHHLSLNFTFSNDNAYSTTPAFLGSNPATYPNGPHAGKMLQDKEHTLALKFAQGLSQKDWAQTKIKNKSLTNILRTPILPEDVGNKKEGIAVSTLSIAQQNQIRQIITLYVGLNRDALKKPYLSLIEEGWDKTYIAWGGDRGENATFYYRIQGPRIFIEFDNSRDKGNHIHAVWRDPKNDFGHDDLRHHIEKHH